MLAKLYKNFLLKILAITNAQQEIAHQGLGNNTYKIKFKERSEVLQNIIIRLAIPQNNNKPIKTHITIFITFLLMFLKKKASAIIMPMHATKVKIWAMPQACTFDSAGYLENNQSLKLMFLS